MTEDEGTIIAPPFRLYYIIGDDRTTEEEDMDELFNLSLVYKMLAVIACSHLKKHAIPGTMEGTLLAAPISKEYLVNPRYSFCLNQEYAPGHADLEGISKKIKVILNAEPPVGPCSVCPNQMAMLAGACTFGSSSCKGTFNFEVQEDV